MTVKQKIGQRFALGFAGTRVTEELRRLVKEYQAGNVILFQNNLESAAQAKALCTEIQELVQGETGYPAFIALDQEGGAVVRLPQDMVNVPGSMALAASGNPENVALAAQITAAELKRIGVNLNLAPVLDINSNRDNPAVGNRSFGVSADSVVLFASSAIKAYKTAGLLCCGKHFPGHGDTTVDSHLDLPLINRTFHQMEARELVPFQAAIDAGIPAIMTTHILFPELEEEKLPATMSRKILSGILREKLGFKGLILSDNMEMKAVKDTYGVAKSCVLALTAGVDIALVCHEPAEMEASFKEVTAAYEDGRFNISEFDTSVDRILRYKEMSKTCCSDGEACSEDLSRRIEQNVKLMRSTLASKEPDKIPPSLGANPLFVGCLAYRSTIASDEMDPSLSFVRWFAHQFNGKSFETPINPNGHEISHIISRLPSSSSIVLGTYNGHLNQGQIELAKVLYHTAERRGIPFVGLALRNPWDISMLPIRAYGLALWEYTLNSFEAAAAVFRNEYIPLGCIPMLGA